MIERAYSPENKHIRLDKQKRTEAQQQIQQLGIQSRITVEELLRMTPRQQVRLRQQAWGD